MRRARVLAVRIVRAVAVVSAAEYGLAAIEGMAVRIGRVAILLAAWAGCAPQDPAGAGTHPGHGPPEQCEMAAGQTGSQVLPESVRYEASGDGLTSVRLKLWRVGNAETTVRIPAGSFFAPSKAGYQPMVTTRDTTLVLRDGEPVSRSLPAVCWERLLETPYANCGVTFTVKAAPRPEVAKVMAALEKANAGSRVAQAVAWILSEDADYAKLGTLEVGHGFSSTRAIREYEATMAMRILDEAGIDITRLAIWRNDRQHILQGLNEGDLKTWLRRRMGL